MRAIRTALAILTFTLVTLALAATAHAASLELDKTDYLPGEDVQIQFTASADWAANAWVGIVPSNTPHGSEATNDAHDVAYEYLDGRASGTLTLKAPGQAGSWDVRMNDTDDNGKEVASVTFKVSRPSVKATLALDKTRVLPGDAIKVKVSIAGKLPDDAWLGIVPSGVPHGSEATNDANDTTYEYLHGRTNDTITLATPGQAGSYDVRLNDSDDNGVEIASQSFTVDALNGKVTLKLSGTRFIPGEAVRVDFTVDGDLPDNAWVGIVPSSVPHGSEATNDQHDVDYEYLHRRASGTLALRAPADGGKYDVRANDSDDNGREVASVSFEVSATVTAADMAAQLRSSGRVALYGIHFDTGKADIRPDAVPVLEQVGQLLGGDAALRLRVEGHTDDVGDDASNLQLSQRRAESVKAYLVGHFHVDAARLDAKGFGEAKPVGDNKTDVGRAQNRRVELAKE